jgi:polyferredoxin
VKPAVRSNKNALLAALLVGGFGLWWYFKPFPWLGAIMGLFGGGFTYLVLTTKRMERCRRVYYIGLFGVALVGLTLIISNMGLTDFLSWAASHQKEYYLPGQSLGVLSYPCTREITQVFFGRAVFLPGLGLWQTTFPSSMKSFLIVMVPFVITGVVFGRGFCGWLCPFGGLNEAMVTGKKERWNLKFAKEGAPTDSEYPYTGLKGWVKDIKYGVLLSIVLLSVSLAFPVVCVFCPTFWLSAMPLFWVIMGLIILFAIILPFMTKHRWWCHVCPLGAVFALFNKISFFQIKIDKKKCIKCLDCVQECRMYALTPDAVQGQGTPSADCIRCGRCIETCPEEAVDMYLLGTSRKVRSIFISLAIAAGIAWYIWFIDILANKIAISL